MRKINRTHEKNISFISYLLVFIMTFNMILSTSAFAIETPPNEESYFTISNGQITKYTGTAIDLVIPDRINGEIVRSIGEKVFYKKGLTSIKIPNTTESIEKQAFATNALTSIELPKTLINMGYGAFSGNKLETVTIPTGLHKIPNVAFSKNSLTSVIIPEGVTNIGMGAFTINKLESIVIPDSVVFIDKMAFKQNSLKNVSISKNTKTIDISVFDSNQLQSVTIPDGVTKIKDAAFKNNKLQSVIIPTNVETIGTFAFDENVSLTYSKLVEAIKHAEEIETSGKSEEKVQALTAAIEAGKQLKNKSKANLLEVNIAVENINKAIEALAGQSSIKEIKPLENIEVDLGTSEIDAKTKLPEKVTVVDSENIEYKINIIWSVSVYHGDIAGEYTATGIFELPKEVVQSNPVTDLKVAVKIIVKAKEVETKAWNIKDFTCTATSIIGFSESGKEKFKTNKDLILPKLNETGKAITEIADKAFLGDYITKQNPEIGINSVNIPETVTTIGAEAFRYNCLIAINIPDSVTTIKMSAFNGNKIKSLVIPDSVTKLESGAFTLNDIEYLKLPNGLTNIPTAFAFNNLTSVTIPEGVTRIEDLAFSDNKLSLVKLPSTLKYLSGLNNNEFTSIIIPQSVTELGAKAFASNKMTSVTIPGNVKVIGERAFWNTWHDQFLSTVNIEEGVEKIGAAAFSNNHLKDVELPSSLKELAKDSFSSNLGYEGIVHLFTPNHENPNNFEENKYNVINPAKLTIKYVFEDKVLKEKAVWTNPTTGLYFHIGDTGVEIIPEYNDNEYELKEVNIIKANLNEKENVVMIQCKKKQVLEEIKIISIGKVAPVAVDFGTNKEAAMDKLGRKTFIVDSNHKQHEVELTWTLGEYNENKAGEYTAIGTFKLPAGVIQSQPETNLEVIGTILVKEKFGNEEDGIWTVEDFTYEQTTVTGFTEQGRGTLKTNKDLVLPKVNRKGESITHIGEMAFKNMGLISVVIPEGLNGLIIEAGAFSENQLKKVFIPEGVSEILTLAFYKNDLMNVDFPGTVTKIGNQAFAYNKLVSITVAKGIGKICLDRFSFYNNQLTSVTILKEVNKIHAEAFKDNTGYENDNNKVHVFMLKLDPENNGLFEFSDYHKIILLAVESIEKINPIEITFGTEKNNIALPKKIKLKLNNADTKEVSVTWLSEDYNVNKAQEYTFTGSYDLPEGMTGKKPEINVKVIVKPDEQGKPVLVTEISLDKTEITILQGKNIVLTAKVSPDNATNKKVIWSSSNEEIATVDATGKVTGIKEGTTTITATTEDGSKVATCEATVKIDECFIATAAYGSKFQPAVVLLRHFRNDYLLSNSFGRAFVKFYYKNSPPIANFIAYNNILKSVVKVLLTPFVVVVYGLYHPIFMCIGLLLIGMLVLTKIRRKLSKKMQ